MRGRALPRVYLHVGATKTGTTFIQSVLTRNRSRLKKRGVLWPGASWRYQVRATNDLLQRNLGRGAPDTTGAWDRLVEEVNAFEGDSAIISMEFLSFADPDTAQRAVASVAPNPVTVVVTARDLARVIPAIWQESVQNGHTMPYRAYLDRLSETGYRGERAGARAAFWGQQDLARTLHAWQTAVDRDNLVLVTVPPPGADRSLLWTRFCEAVHLDPEGLRPAKTGNESLGATSAELMRRANVRAKKKDADWATLQTLKWRVAKRQLSQRKDAEPTLVLPHDYWPWVMKAQRDLVTEIKQVRPRVIGSLDDLLYANDRTPPQHPPGTTTAPAHTPPEQLLDAALDALVGLSGDFANKEAARKASPAHPDTDDDGDDTGLDLGGEDDDASEDESERS